MNIDIPIKTNTITKIILSLIGIEIMFVAIYAIDFVNVHPSWQFCELFDLDRESNIPTWFSTFQLLMIGLISLSVCIQKNYSLPPSKAGLLTFGAGFIYLSIDEASAIHEKITYTFHDNLLVPYFDGVHGIWIVVYGAIGLTLLTIFHRDVIAVWKSLRRESIIFIVGIIIYLIGAAGAETITFFHIDKSNPTLYTMEVIFEEFFEMLGASLLLCGTLHFATKKLAH